MASRFTLPPDEYRALTERVYHRDKGCCRVCKSTVNLSCHHIIFRSEGGGDLSSNLVMVCGSSPYHQGCHEAIHGKNSHKFIQILAGDGDEDTVPNADSKLMFKKYPTVRRRIRWKATKSQS